VNQKWVEYWVGRRDDYGDLIDYDYQGPSKAAAMAAAREALLDTAAGDPEDDTASITVERVTRWGNEDDGVVRAEYEDVATFAVGAGLRP
jgi:hypothetical protein